VVNVSVMNASVDGKLGDDFSVHRAQRSPHADSAHTVLVSRSQN
jgi:hypothetical protein